MKNLGARKRLYRVFFMNVLLAMFILSACGKSEKKVENNIEGTESEEIIYTDEDVVVSKLEALDKVEYTHYEWSELNYDKAINGNDTIVEGIIESIEEIGIKNTYMGYENTIYKTLLNIKVKEIVVDNTDVKIDDNVKIVVSVSSRTYDQFVPCFIEGDRYLFFLKSCDNIKEDNLKVSNYSDFYIDMPEEYIIPVVDNELYQVRSFFSNLCESKNVNLKDILYASEHEANERYSDIFNQNNGYKISGTLRTRLNMDKLERFGVSEEDIIRNIAHKKYESVGTFCSDVSCIYFVTKNDFIKEISKVLKKD